MRVRSLKHDQHRHGSPLLVRHLVQAAGGLPGPRTDTMRAGPRTQVERLRMPDPRETVARGFEAMRRELWRGALETGVAQFTVGETRQAAERAIDEAQKQWADDVSPFLHGVDQGTHAVETGRRHGMSADLAECAGRFTLGDMHRYRMTDEGKLVPVPVDEPEPEGDGSTGRIVAVDREAGYVRVAADPDD